jgi:hypothetical protein
VRRPGSSIGVKLHLVQIEPQFSQILRSIIAPNARESSRAEIPDLNSSKSFEISLSTVAHSSRKRLHFRVDFYIIFRGLVESWNWEPPKSRGAFTTIILRLVSSGSSGR